MISIEHLPHQDDPDLPRGASGYKAAFHKAVEEYNSFGLAEGNVKYQIDTGTAEQLYLFKVTLLSKFCKQNLFND